MATGFESNARVYFESNARVYNVGMVGFSKRISIRDWIILGLILVFTFGVFFVDMFLLPGVVLPGAPYFIPIVFAAYYLPPRLATGVAALDTILKLLADLAEQAPFWLVALYFAALVLVSYLSRKLSAKTMR